jgi:predicted HTH transcriptional regulator
LILMAIMVFTGALYLTYRIASSKQRSVAKVSNQINWQEILAGGESEFIEFKSSLRWDYRQEKLNKALEHVIAKTISAFLNASGGTLFIGVDDTGNVLGLIPDYQCLSKKNSDGFLLALTDVINRYLGKKIHRFISARIINTGESEICMVTMTSSDTPVFVGTGNEQEFFIRATASSQPLNMSEALEYIKSHWKKRG